MLRADRAGGEGRAARLASWVSGLVGWRRALAAAGLGVLAALAQAPYALLPLLLVSVPGLFLLLEGARAAPRPLRSAFLIGLAYGVGSFGLGLYWIAFAFLVQADQFAWMIPVLVPGLVGFLALYPALACAGAVRAWRGPWGRGPAVRALTLAGLLALAEYGRGHLFTGFPWNLTSQATAGWLPLAQGGALVGPFGLSLVLLALLVLPGAALVAGRRWPLAAAAGGLAALAILGGLRLGATPPMAPEVRVVVVQPSVPQRDKLDPALRDANLARMVDMTEAALARVPTGVASYAVWPENAYPFLNEIPDIEAGLATRMPPGATLIAGSVTATPRTDDPGAFAFGNSVLVFGPTAEGRAALSPAYDKHHLVPFGEYLPLKGLFDALGLASLSPVGAGGFTPGAGPAVMPIGPAPFAPLVCYEDVFPHELYPDDQRPDWLVVVTNDAWFGDGAGPAQHLAIAQMRAVESGLPVARSANTGISAVIDAKGRVLDSLPLYEAGVIETALPAPAARTPYDRLGDAGFWLMLAMVAGLPWVSGLARIG